FIGLPVRLGHSGIQEIVEVDLNESEQALMDISADHIRSNFEALRRVLSQSSA
ncbi:MAG: hypothetical protein F4058_03340, partial [Rhodothermaceae bacterium]|nr:hypothetical protein [Rhodothermaceae bacterium]